MISSKLLSSCQNMFHHVMAVVLKFTSCWIKLLVLKHKKSDHEMFMDLFKKITPTVLMERFWKKVFKIKISIY